MLLRQRRSPLHSKVMEFNRAQKSRRVTAGTPDPQAHQTAAWFSFVGLSLRRVNRVVWSSVDGLTCESLNAGQLLSAFCKDLFKLADARAVLTLEASHAGPTIVAICQPCPLIHLQGTVLSSGPFIVLNLEIKLGQSDIHLTQIFVVTNGLLGRPIVRSTIK
jgi:hypothetical protein